VLKPTFIVELILQPLLQQKANLVFEFILNQTTPCLKKTILRRMKLCLFVAMLSFLSHSLFAQASYTVSKWRYSDPKPLGFTVLDVNSMITILVLQLVLVALLPEPKMVVQNGIMVHLHTPQQED